MAKIIPEWVERQMEERKFVMQLPEIPEKYKHLIMVAVAAAVGSKMCTKFSLKLRREEV